MQKIAHVSGKPGRDGRPQEIQKATTKRTHDLDLRASTADYLSCGSTLDDAVPRDASDRAKGLARVYGDIRRNIAQAIVKDRELLTAGLKSVDWMASGGGGGSPQPSGGGGDFESGLRFDALYRTVPPHLMALLHDVVLQDRYVWEIKTGTRVSRAQERERVLEQLREALDYAALAYGHLGDNAWKRYMLPRWQSARDLELRRAIEAARQARREDQRP